MASANPRMKFVWLSQALAGLAVFWLAVLVLYILAAPGEISPGTPNRVLFFELFIGSAVAVAGAVFAWAELFLRSFSYELGEKELAVNKGIISRKRTSIPYDKIKEIRILRSGLNFFDQVFGLSTLRIESSEKKPSITIPGVENPDEVIRTILARTQGRSLPSEIRAPGSEEEAERRILQQILDELKEIREAIEKSKAEPLKPKPPSFKEEVLGGVEREFSSQDEFSKLIKREEELKRKKK